MQVMNIDWLKYYGTLENSFTQQTHITQSGFIIDQLPLGTKTYNNNYLVMTQDGEAVAKMECNPRLKSMPKNAATLHIANQWLYSSVLPDIVEELMASLEYKPNNISRLDIALDGCNNVPVVLNNYIKQRRQNIGFNKMGSSRLNAYHIDEERLDFKRFTIGSAKSEKYISIYCKSDELKNSLKTYIADQWRLNNINTTGDVYRCEARLTSKYLDTIYGFKMENIFDEKYLQDLYYTSTYTNLDFRKNTYKHKEKNERIQVIDYSQLSHNKLDRQYHLNEGDQYKTKMASHLINKHILMNLHEEPELNILQRANDILIGRANLQQWESHKIEEWASKYISMAKINELFTSK